MAKLFKEGHDINNGRKLTQEHKEAISKGLKEYYSNPENRERRSQILILPSWSEHEHPAKGYKHTEKAKEAMRQSKLGIKISKETIVKRISTLKLLKEERISERRSQSHKKYYENHEVWNKGIAHSEETRKRISEGMRRYWNNGKRKQ